MFRFNPSVAAADAHPSVPGVEMRLFADAASFADDHDGPWHDNPNDCLRVASPVPLTRKQMFALLKERGVKVALPISNDQLAAKLAGTGTGA